MHAGRLLRPLNQTTKPVHQTDRPPHHCRPDSRPDLRSDHQTQSPNYQSIRSGRFHQARPPKPTRLLYLTTQLQISTAHPIFRSCTGQVHSLWVGSRGVYRALDEPCKAYFPHTFGLKFPDFLFDRLNLTVVRLVSGVPRVGKGLPFPFS